MRHKRLRLRVKALLMAAVMVALCAAPMTASASQQTELENQLRELQKQQDTIKKNLSKAKNDLSASQQRRNLVSSQINNLVKQLNIIATQTAELDKQLGETQTQITATEVEIAANEAAAQDTKDKLAQRLRALMKSGNVTTIQMLLNSQSYTDFLLKAEAVKRISANDQAMITELETALKELAAKKQTLTDKKAQLQQDKQAMEEKLADSNAKKKELDSLYATAQSEVSSDQSAVSDFNNQLKDEYASHTKLIQVKRNGDMKIEGEITQYTQRNKSVAADGRSAQTELSITVNVRFTNNANHDEDFERQFTASKSYETTKSLNSVQEELVTQMVKDLAEQIFNATVANW